METIIANWEKRNLGVTCEELTVTSDDLLESVLLASEELTAQYQIIKVPSGRTDLLFELQKHGFTFIESNIHFTKKLTRNTLPKPFSSLQEKVEYRSITEKEYEPFLDIIRNNSIFTTDKVALDPHFSPKHSANRYYYWAKDVLSSDGQGYVVSMNKKDIGFFILRKHSESLYESFLAGVYPEHSKSNMGFAVLSSPIVEAFKRGGRIIETGTSSNNTASLRLHLALGYELQSINYVLVRHINLR
ncbi:GNAT family N-acetyltransferase [Heyndrickxia acidicola]|uniref:GNAT family N-acetyltransferase n=1 Tax=Heyndrickxia acidicola TaxID=209389 RepID=A0ABU6MJR8_9BACI|nr:GNAT family N-acetyltransferase [Heyndrickxia acidicola]MED1204714.1 GNAT family N-acetyltransferase [Heyndrickxia acidicola]